MSDQDRIDELTKRVEKLERRWHGETLHARGIIIWNEMAIPVAELSSTTDGGGISIFNSEGQETVLLGATADGGGALLTFDGKGKMTGHLP